MRRSLGLAGAGACASWSIAYRNAASVLPDPVGAEMRTCSPEAIAGQAWLWAAVGPANAPVNQSRVRGLKSASDTAYRRSGPTQTSVVASPGPAPLGCRRARTHA